MYQFHISRSASGPRIPLSSPPVEIIVLARREPEALIKAKAVSPDDRDYKRYSYEVTKIVEVPDEFEMIKD